MITGQFVVQFEGDIIASEREKERIMETEM